jgi:hypothetical protein
MGSEETPNGNYNQFIDALNIIVIAVFAPHLKSLPN